METHKRVYLDTNVFITAFERKDVLSILLEELFARRNSGGTPQFVTSELTLSELLVLPYRTNAGTFIDTYTAVIQPSEWLDVPLVARSVLTQAAWLRSRKPSIKLPDAIHISTATIAGCSYFLTADIGIKSENLDTALPFEILRPDEPKLTSLIESLSA